ncbi:Pre-mRNA-splicing factor CWC25 [Phytophthora citrophthora]|uniref:Pre-mRNA-splicing factor CWC25 n=1 Tax=Phytophthora citrophthora TaxID=4793 RepID=A0AAD9LQS2_9STRA|nr:Pre-mRNA-splicing factor CWC25 [Phytophthora citrophthora]
MSLAFLSKKSWHTANLRVRRAAFGLQMLLTLILHLTFTFIVVLQNVEKVWIAEQKHAAEEKKVAELRKNIEEERQLQELRQLQAARGDKSAAVERVDWMYEGPSAAREKTAEEYLLGKEYKGEDEKAAKEDVDLSSTTKYGSLALTKSALPANDAFQRLNEDPMMLIRKRQQAAREQVLKNPVKMKRIKDEVDRLKEDKKARKKAKKAAKKEKKHARREEKRRLKRKADESDRSDFSEDEEEEKTSYRHHGYPSKHYRGDRGRVRSQSRSISRSRSPVPEHHGRDRNRSRSRRSERHSERRERSSDRSSRDKYGDERRRATRDRRGSRHYHSRSRSPERRGHSCSRSRSRSPPERDNFGRDRPTTRRSVDRRSKMPPRRDAHRRHGEYQTRNRSRSSMDRHSRTPTRRGTDRHRESHRERNHSRSPVDRRDSRRSRSSGRKDDTEHGRSSSRHENIRREGAGELINKRMDDREARRKPLDVEGKYGLVSKTGAVESKDVDKTSLGPNAKYLAKAREAKRLEEEERRRKLGRSTHRESRELTDEEKKRMAQQMIEDAKQRDEYVAKRATMKKDELDKREKEATSSNPEFLRKLHSEAYLDGESNMSDRLRRNAHYIQRKADASNFLSK